MKRTRTVLLLVLLALVCAAPGARADEEKCRKRRIPDPVPAKPRVDVVFVLDTTGSMSGLIEGAKRKIWSMVNQIVSGKPVPEVRVGLVAYRDRGDAYVTKHTALTGDLDKIYATIRGFAASGGGDGPESVNQALHEAVTKMKWDRGERTLKVVYLVGDAPPHMDYEQDVHYPVTCEKAARAGIIINSVQCGNVAATTPIWQEIARKAEGKYVRIDQSGGMKAIATPFDARLAELSRKLSGTAVFYGSREDRRKAKKDLDEADDRATDAPAEAGASRAGFRAKSGKLSRRDLLQMIEEKKLKVSEIEKKQLPESLAKLDKEARAKKIAELIAERKKIREELLVLDKKREAHIRKELAKAGAKKDGFDAKVLDFLREQALKIGVKYE